MKSLLYLTLLVFIAMAALSTEFHVATNGTNSNPGTRTSPLRTIQHAADLAQPGDTVSVHAGVYRERINPPRGSDSDARRIVYQAAGGEKVVITGSEEVKNWEKVQDNVWKATLPNTFFGSFNPLAEVISGDCFHDNGRTHHVGAVYPNGDWLTEAVNREEILKPMTATPLCFASVDAINTVIWAQFKDIDPNAQQVEVNARQSVFYPDKTGRNYITVRGFTLRNAATPWAPPTVEQIGLIGVHWSKGWIIENNDIAYSTCSGITLGKYGDAQDHNSGSAKGYVGTIERGLKNGWNKESIVHHVVRNNHISHCEQAGIVGSLGPAFSIITGNIIHDIHVRRLFSGAEMGGIKLHATIDTLIADNHIHHTTRCLWLDWMAQGTRVSANLFHDNTSEDVFMEVNRGPYLLDNNILLSTNSILDVSQGGAFVHNLIAGIVISQPEHSRATPYHPAQSTAVAGIVNIQGGDNRFFNNLFIGKGSRGGDTIKAVPAKPQRRAGFGLSAYDLREAPLLTGGNVFYHGAQPWAKETGAVVDPDRNPGLALAEDGGTFTLKFTPGADLTKTATVTTATLGKAKISSLPYENPDGTPVCIDRDVLGEARNNDHPTAGPFEKYSGRANEFVVWRVKAS